MKNRIKQIKKTTTYKKGVVAWKKVNRFITERPFPSLFIVLALLLLVIAFNAYLRKPVAEEAEEVETKVVDIYSVGQTPRLQLSAQVKESNVISIMSQAGGIVRSVSVEPGQRVYANQQLVGLSSNYYGGSAPTVQRQIAQVQHDNVVETYDTQKELIAQQREVAETQADNAEELRKITESSLGETRTLLELNESMLSVINTAIESATTSAELSSLNAQKAQLLSGINQIKSGLRQAEYQANEDKPPADLAELNKELTLKQLQLQEKSLEMSKEISGLQLKLARIQEATMYPGTPFAGVVERVFVTKGQTVSPGTPLATIKADQGCTQLIALVSKEVAERISILEPTYVTIEGQQIELYPDFVSSVPTDGKLYSVVYTLGEQYTNKLTNTGHVAISVPVGTVDSNAVIPFLPLETIHQSELETTVFVVENDQVVSKEIVLGTVNGSYVEVKEGLDSQAQVVLNRDVIEGQKVVIR